MQSPGGLCSRRGIPDFPAVTNTLRAAGYRNAPGEAWAATPPHPKPTMIWDLSELPAAARASLAETVQRGFHEDALKAQRRQLAVAKENAAHRPRSQDGLGELTMQIDPVYYVDAAWYFRDPEGNPDYQWTTDPDKVRWYTKRHEAVQVKSEGTRLQVGYGQSSPNWVTKGGPTETTYTVNGRPVRFHKVYPESKPA